MQSPKERRKHNMPRRLFTQQKSVKQYSCRQNVNKYSKQAALTLYAVGLNTEAIIAGDFKTQVGLVHVCPLSVFGCR